MLSLTLMSDEHFGTVLAMEGTITTAKSTQISSSSERFTLTNTDGVAVQ